MAKVRTKREMRSRRKRFMAMECAINTAIISPEE